MICSRLVKGKHLEPRSKALDLLAIMFGAGRLGGAMEQFRKHDGGDAKAVRLEIEPVAKLRRAIAEHANAEVRIEQIAQQANRLVLRG